MFVRLSSNFNLRLYTTYKMSFTDKVVIVTGSGSGIGEATAILFAKEGADVVIVDWNEENAHKTADKCKTFANRVLTIKTDVSKAADAKNAIDKTIKTFGKLDVLVNNAGIIRRGNLLSGTIMDTYDEVLNTDLRGVVMLTSLATPHLIKTKGCIVNTSSIASLFIPKGKEYPAYTIAKVGVDCFTKLTAIELAPMGVRANAVNPGPVLTNVLVGSGADSTFDDYARGTALKKCSDPSEIADLIVFLASDRAKSITGTTHLIDNGMSLV